MVSKSVQGNLVDVLSKRIFPAEVIIEGGRIVEIQETDRKLDGFIIPGFVDSHVHIESSMLTPYEFSRSTICHGTVGVVTDPHEIANVLGVEGVEYMLEDAEKSPQKIAFGAPSCVPATPFETSGAIISDTEVVNLFEKKPVILLSEMMNFPGVISGDKEIKKKISSAKRLGYPVDGHAPGLRGEKLQKYVSAGITTDHECFTLEEAREKISMGMKIQIREGSGAKNFDTLIPLLKESPENVLFCTDDLHPDDLQKGHINLLVKRSIKLGYDLFAVLRASSHNAIKHYNLEIGLLQKGDPADFLLVDSLVDFTILSTYIEGEEVYNREMGNSLPAKNSREINNFCAEKIRKEDIYVKKGEGKMRFIKAIDGELITREGRTDPKLFGEEVISDIDNDILKIVVLNRYTISKPSVGFIQGFGLKEGALGSSIAHDSHNIICIGTNDEDIIETINWIIEKKGGIIACSGNTKRGLALEIGGIMTAKTSKEAAGAYEEVSEFARSLGSELKAPLMTLAFMSLLVIPEIKLSDKGLFDGNKFEFISLFEAE